MRTLNAVEIKHISGGCTLQEAIMHTIAPITFYTTLAGTVASAIYSLLTNHTVTTVVGNKFIDQSSFVSTFWTGVGISAMSGMMLGGMVHMYQSMDEEHSRG